MKNELKTDEYMLIKSPPSNYSISLLKLKVVGIVLVNETYGLFRQMPCLPMLDESL
jgi:hypothetical protein